MDVKRFKSDYSGAFDLVDKAHPYYHLNTGLFELPFSRDDVNAYTYIPEETTNSCWSATLLLPNGASAPDFLLSSGWKNLADTEKLVVFLAQPEKGEWAEVGDPVAVVEELRSKVDVRDHYVTQVFFAYLAGYDEGAEVALRYTMKHPGAYAGLACVGDWREDMDFDDLASRGCSSLPYEPADSIAVPVYFSVAQSTDSLAKAFGHFVKRNKSGDAYESAGRMVSPACLKYGNDTVNGQPVADVVADVSRFDSLVSPEATAALWGQLHRTIRTTGIGPGGLHSFKTLDELGITTHEIVVDGWARHWCEYVPHRNVSRSEKLPVVVFFHGGTQIAESGLYGAEWFNVAESRDFIALFPSGGIAQSRMNANPMPTWNISCEKEFYLDDESFIRAMIDEVAARLPVDRSRIYATGHSMGSGMTQRCLMSMPDIFAAGVSNSGVVLGSYDLPNVNDSLDVAVWIEIGEHDVDPCDLSKSDRVKKNIEYWIGRGGLDLFDEAGDFQCGRYLNKEWCNGKGVPMLRYTAALDKVHAVMPQDAWSYYDDFMCKFSRDEDGLLRYMGKPVR